MKPLISIVTKLYLSKFRGCFYFDFLYENLNLNPTFNPNPNCNPNPNLTFKLLSYPNPKRLSTWNKLARLCRVDSA